MLLQLCVQGWAAVMLFQLCAQGWAAVLFQLCAQGWAAVLLQLCAQDVNLDTHSENSAANKFLRHEFY